MQSTKRVVITGLGALTPIGNNVQTFWENLVNGVSGVGEITRFDPAKFKTRFACEIKNYDPLNFFDKKEARRMDSFSQYGMIAVEEAIQDAKIDFDKVDVERIGVIFSSSIGGFETFEKGIKEYVQMHHNPRFSPFFVTRVLANSIAGNLSIKYGLRGVNYSPLTACASSNQGLIHAYNYIKWGKADIVVAGGSEAPITEACIGGFNTIHSLSTNNDNFANASRPYDKARDGFVMGEGAAALMVESLESAQKRGAKIYAEIVGGGETADAYHITRTHPDGRGAHLAMKEALREGNINPNEVDYINLHATSTPVGDISEITAITKTFTDQKALSVSATKSMTGHLLGAAGAIEAITTCLATHTDKIPPTINTTEVDEKVPDNIDLNLGKASNKTVNFALNNSFGFGGHCACIAMKKYEE
ncbi:beta-ketoacyl-[acyl-carrier-protein] synthase II [marine bacterium AO1-C]|nr:beta-ketoacyl-[acyl-carrier-protein] synthase II [marine bacterium AO1-C]